MFRKLSVLAAILLAGIFVAVSFPQEVQLSFGPAGVATPQPGKLLVAVSLGNTGNRAVGDLRIQSIQLANATLKTPLPFTINAVRARGGEILQAEFDSTSLRPGKPYELVLQGTYHEGREDYDKDRDGNGPTVPFTVHTPVFLPPPSPGKQEVGKVQIPPQKTEGVLYGGKPPAMERDVNQAAPPVPRTTTQLGSRTPTPSNIQPAPAGDPPAITFLSNDPVGVKAAGLGCSGDSNAGCAEPSGASGNGVILISANWNIAYSTDNGSTFTVLSPTSIFPADAVGFCCDQIIQYAPSIDRFIWLLQGTGYRLAMASPAQIKSSGGKSWTYWNLTPGLFGSCTSPDYPDLSIGDNSLYISWDAGGGSSCTAGFQVVRTSLAGIQAAGTITLEFTDPANAPVSTVWGEHLTQNTGDEIFWAGHNGNDKLTVYSLQESSNTYFWRDVGISGWDNNAPTSTTPDGLDWLAKNFNGPGGNSFPRNGIIGAARSNNLLWFGWTAGTDSKNFQQAHIEIVTLDRLKNFAKTQQVQVWNNSYAFAYPSFSSNACTGELGMSFEYGGNGNYENHVVGFWGDFVAYITTNSDAGDDRFGDYVSIRRAPVSRQNPGNLFTAFGFGINKQPAPATGKQTDIRYVLFGRPSCSRPAPPTGLTATPN